MGGGGGARFSGLCCGLQEDRLQGMLLGDGVSGDFGDKLRGTVDGFGFMSCISGQLFSDIGSMSFKTSGRYDSVAQYLGHLIGLEGVVQVQRFGFVGFMWRE